MDLQSTPPRKRPTFLRAFIPLWVALFISSWMLAADFHERHSRMIRVFADVTIEGKRAEEGISVRIGNAMIEPGIAVPIGWRSVSVAASGTEADTHRHWIWYGFNNLGQINLTRERGNLALRVQPEPDKLTAVGTFASRTLAASSNLYDFGSLPAGEYEVMAAFEKVVSKKMFTVARNRTNLADFTVPLGRLEITSDPPDADFSIESGNSAYSSSGKLPIVFRFLPPDRYVIRASRGDYRKERTAYVTDRDTAKVQFRFDYGEVEITSDPSQAKVFRNSEAVGTTPFASGMLIPGAYEYQIVKDGYEPSLVDISAEGGATTNVAAKLVNSRYWKAFSTAQSAYQNGNYAEALDQLDTALRVIPDDPKATALLPKAKAGSHRQKAMEMVSAQRFDDAIAEIDTAAKVVPDDPDTESVRKKILESMESAKNQQQEQQFAGWIGGARTAAASGNFPEARRNIDFADRLKPNSPALAAVRAEINNLEIASRRRYAAESYRRGLEDEPDAAAFLDILWHVAKPAAEVRAACVKIGSTRKAWKAVEKGKNDANEVSMQLGSVIPVLGLGAYTRLHAYQVSENETEIRVKILYYIQGEHSPTPNRDPFFQQNAASFLKQELSLEL